MFKSLSHLSLTAGCKSLLAILLFLCIYNSPVNAQAIVPEGEEVQFTFKDVAFDAYQMDGVWIDSNKKIITIQYGGYNYFICCTSPYDVNPVFIVMRSTDMQQLTWNLDEDGNILGYKETKPDWVPGLEIMTPTQRQEYMSMAQAQCKNAILIRSGRVKEQRQQGINFNKVWIWNLRSKLFRISKLQLILWNYYGQFYKNIYNLNDK